jgi:hypothetical protein
MSWKPNRPGSKSGGSKASYDTGVKPIGSVRRSQLVSTYAIGAILDLEDGSCMPMGLEEWANSARVPSLHIHEPRLEAQLSVRHFVAPPIKTDIPNSQGNVDPIKTILAVRFPRWHECPKCHRLGIETYPFELDRNRLRCTACKAIANPVRFVTACRRGHIDDFPWVWWAHRRKSEDTCKNPVLFLKSFGGSAALGDLFVECKTCESRANMGDAFGAKTFERRSCTGMRPWLGDREACTEIQRTLQRGASNVHFAVQATALSIPPTSGPEFQIIADLKLTLEVIEPDNVQTFLGNYARKFGVDAERLIAAWASQAAQRQSDGVYTDAVFRAEEYHALSVSANCDPVGGYVANFENLVYHPTGALSKWFDRIGAVSRLREVRVNAGFSRIEPYPVAGENILQALRDGKISPIARDTNLEWLPGTEIRGEGIFLRFREDAIDEWLSSNERVMSRAAALDKFSAAVAAKRGYKREYAITARLLLVHSFAHAAIREMSLECGYAAASIRERLYVSEPTEQQEGMSGVLLYTGSPDSDGSLGGLVRMADEPFLESLIINTIAAARWCGSDPVCLETDPGQSGERISGAACHSCLLLPETACEKFNRELDRSMLVGSYDDSWDGFFSSSER